MHIYVYKADIYSKRKLKSNGLKRFSDDKYLEENLPNAVFAFFLFFGDQIV